MPVDSLINGLLDPGAYPHPCRDIRLVETHISWVFLTGDFAYKIKKPVRLGFLDFSTLELRLRFCEEELHINRRTAPELYIGIVPIGTESGKFRIGLNPAVEYAVQMRQFPHDARLDRRLASGQLARGQVGGLAATIADFHSGLTAREARKNGWETRCIVRPALNNFRHLEADGLPDATRQQLAIVESWTRQQCRDLEPHFERRAAQGFVRECHGDLHLENLLWLDGRFVLFDAIEFEPKLRWIDTANDVAFAVMDILARGRQDLAWALLNDWLQGTGDYDALAVMRFYLAYRSMVRAVVTAIRRNQRRPDRDSARPDTEVYVELAARLSDTPAPNLYLMHGVSGSGKTWISDRLVGALPALRVRSDIERKRGLPEEASPADEGVGKGKYSRGNTDRTYHILQQHCATGLVAGFDMIADATFLARRHREQFTRMASDSGARVLIIDCRAPETVLRERVRQRLADRRDASDADIAVLEHQLCTADHLDREECARTVEVDSRDSPEDWIVRIRDARPSPL